MTDCCLQHGSDVFEFEDCGFLPRKTRRFDLVGCVVPASAPPHGISESSVQDEVHHPYGGRGETLPYFGGIQLLKVLRLQSDQGPPPEGRFNVIDHQLAVAAPRLGAEIWFHGHQRRLEKGPKPKSRRAARPALGYALLNPPQLCKGIAAGTSVNILATLAWDGQIRAPPPILALADVSVSLSPPSA